MKHSICIALLWLTSCFDGAKPGAVLDDIGPDSSDSTSSGDLDAVNQETSGPSEFCGRDQVFGKFWIHRNDPENESDFMILGPTDFIHRFFWGTLPQSPCTKIPYTVTCSDEPGQGTLHLVHCYDVFDVYMRVTDDGLDVSFAADFASPMHYFYGGPADPQILLSVCQDHFNCRLVW